VLSANGMPTTTKAATRVRPGAATWTARLTDPMAIESLEWQHVSEVKDDQDGPGPLISEARSSVVLIAAGQDTR
jgi:hypothetical protein